MREDEYIFPIFYFSNNTGKDKITADSAMRGVYPLIIDLQSGCSSINLMKILSVVVSAATKRQSVYLFIQPKGQEM